MPDSPPVCTKGSQPQVITLSLDLLSLRGRRITELVILHTDPSLEPARSSLSTLAETLEEIPTARIRAVILENEHGPVADLTTPEEAAGYLCTAYRTVLELKQDGKGLDLNLSGSRKPMSIYAMVVAQLLFAESSPRNVAVQR